ncbi:MAG: methyltransferase domain-containing protein [Planctomycetaceae bacterium]|nr:methyltransferase domain-containing protein [Planctomycetaceae bacterium]
MLRQLRDQVTFFREFRRRYETTGAIAPSSRFLARSMTRFLAQRDPQIPVRVLEVGPGTGPVTDLIVRLLKPGDVFDLVELNETFVERLNDRFSSEAHWMAVRDRSTIHQIALQDYQATENYDFLISGLPLNNFPADLVETIADSYFKLLKPNGILSYFEYMYIRPIRKVVTRGTERTRIVRIDEIMRSHCHRSRIRRDNIWMNTPPAWVQHLKADGAK